MALYVKELSGSAKFRTRCILYLLYRLIRQIQELKGSEKSCSDAACLNLCGSECLRLIYPQNPFLI